MLVKRMNLTKPERTEALILISIVACIAGLCANQVLLYDFAELRVVNLAKDVVIFNVPKDEYNTLPVFDFVDFRLRQFFVKAWIPAA